VGRIGSPRIYCDELVPLQLQSVSFQRLGNQKAIRNLSRKTPTPEIIDPNRRELVMHGLDDLGGRDRFGARKSLQKRCKSEEMIAVSVGDVDRSEILAARDDSIQ
jgi:hypothetical protein